jgi:hypothetical protein
MLCSLREFISESSKLRWRRWFPPVCRQIANFDLL